MKMHTKLMFGTAAMLAALTLGYAADEPPKADRPPERGERGGGRGERGPGGDWRQQMEERLKADLGATEDEWKLLKPRLDKVAEARRASFAGFGGGRRGPGGPGGGPGGPGGPPPEGDRPQSEVAKANDDLNKALEDKGASADAIKTKLAALRAAREKARQDTAKAQAELKEVLTARQEAVLVSRGVLE